MLFFSLAEIPVPAPFGINNLQQGFIIRPHTHLCISVSMLHQYLQSKIGVD